MPSNNVQDLIKRTQRNKATSINLSFKNLETLPPEILELKNLTELNLSENQLTSLPTGISELKNLIKLNIYHNELTSLPPEISELKNLIELDITKNQLTFLPPEISELKDLTKLNISGNRLTSLPTEITELENLTELRISENQLTSLPPEITELKNLKVLNISNNQLISLPPELSELKYLSELRMSGNQLTSLPPQISELKNLTVLSLYGNQLTSLPSEIKELRNLNRLIISGNQITSLPPQITQLENLSELEMSSNQLTSLPPEIIQLKHLNRLNISDNQLTSLPSEIKELKNLNRLEIYDNQLTSLPHGISELKHLTILDICGNQLTSLPPEILELDLDIEWTKNWKKRWRNKAIYLSENPFKNPPVEILKEGRKAVFDYFRSLEGEQKQLNEVKILLVGDGGAGKTSLVKMLFGEEVEGNEPQTQGINIRKWVVDSGEREIKANFWDFGGQEIMHATHQFFLSKRSLYILVLDGRKDEKPEYWLKLIEKFGGDSPVMIVINKIDENPSFELNRKFLQAKYRSIRGFYRLSCKSKEGVEEFSKILKGELKQIKHLEIKWPKNWFNVKNRLEKIRPNCAQSIEDSCEYCNYIEYEEYKKMCDQEGIKSESEQNTLVDFLHDLGIILHFRDIPLLNTHVLEPEWVTNAIYKIVNSRDIAESRGVLKLDVLPGVLKQNKESDFYYPPNQYNFIISLMKKFELSYDLDDHTMLLPGLLEIQEPDFDFEYEDALKFIIDYDFLPPSVMPRFIVKMNEVIKNDLLWRTGVVLEDKNFNSIAVVRADNEAKRINIYVKGEQRRDYFVVILQKFREINNSFEKLKAIEKIPLPDNPDLTVQYRHLIKLEQEGIERFIPEGSDDYYLVSELLGAVINWSSERALLELILQMTGMNVDNGKKILSVLQKIENESINEDTLFEKANKIFSVEPSICGVGVNVNEMFRMLVNWRTRRS